MMLYVPFPNMILQKGQAVDFIIYVIVDKIDHWREK